MVREDGQSRPIEVDPNSAQQGAAPAHLVAIFEAIDQIEEEAEDGVSIASLLFELKSRIRALAPPSAPPMQQIEDELPPICMEPTPFAVKDDPVDGSFSGVAPCGQPLVCPKHEGANEDRMLLLKALLLGEVEEILFDEEGAPEADLYWQNGERETVKIDPEGFPILTDSLRAALTEATK